MMADAALGFRVWFCGENIETAIDLKRVGIDNLGVELFREFDCQRGFSDGGGTNDEESILHVVTMFLAVYLTPRTRSSASDGTESNIEHRTLIIQYSRFERHALSRAKF